MGRPCPRPRAQARRWHIDAGISRVEEDEDPLDPALALACINDPARLRLICDEYGVWGDTVPFVCLGGFQNTCGVYGLEEGEGLVLVMKGNVLPCCGIAERKTIGEMEQDFLKAK